MIILMYRMISLDQMRYFVMAAKYQNINHAAKALSISPSAVSSAVTRIEEHLGHMLFDRVGRSIVLNKDGARLKKSLDGILDELIRIETNFSEESGKLDGEYRLAGSHFLSIRHLTRAWTQLQLIHPGLKGELIAAHTATVLEEVLRGTMDFGLCFSPMKHPDLEFRPFHQGQLRIAVRKGHPVLDMSAREQLKAISKFSAAIHKSSPGVEFCENHPIFGQFGIQPQIRLLYDSDDQAIEAVGLSDCWTFIPDLVFESFKKKIELLPMPRGWSAPYEVTGVFARHRQSNLVLEALVHQLATIWGK
jgi:DNA-binding transcriptional LysR family regulator